MCSELSQFIRGQDTGAGSRNYRVSPCVTMCPSVSCVMTNVMFQCQDAEIIATINVHSAVVFRKLRK